MLFTSSSLNMRDRKAMCKQEFEQSVCLVQHVTYASWTCDEQACCRDELHRTTEFNRAGTTAGGWLKTETRNGFHLNTHCLTQQLLLARDTCVPLSRVKNGVKIRKRVKVHKYKKYCFCCILVEGGEDRNTYPFWMFHGGSCTF